METTGTSRRVLLLLALQRTLAARPVARNEVWREFVPLVTDSSSRLTVLQEFMLVHRNEPVLSVLDYETVANLDACIEDLQKMQLKLRQLRGLLLNGG